MKTGTKSLLFGVHQFIWHPLTVLLAWIKLYGWPAWEELVCIIIHDWGYWGKSNMDGELDGSIIEKVQKLFFRVILVLTKKAVKMGRGLTYLTKSLKLTIMKLWL